MDGCRNRSSECGGGGADDRPFGGPSFTPACALCGHSWPKRLVVAAAVVLTGRVTPAIPPILKENRSGARAQPPPATDGRHRADRIRPAPTPARAVQLTGNLWQPLVIGLDIGLSSIADQQITAGQQSTDHHGNATSAARRPVTSPANNTRRRGWSDWDKDRLARKRTRDPSFGFPFSVRLPTRNIPAHPARTRPICCVSARGEDDRRRPRSPAAPASRSSASP